MKVPWGAGAETSLYTATPYNLEISTQIMPHPWLRHRNAFQGKPVLNKPGGEVWLCCFIGVLVLFWNCVCTHVCMIVGVYVHAHTHMYAPWHTWNSWLSSSKKLQDRLWSEGLHFLPVLQSFSLSFLPSLTSASMNFKMTNISYYYTVIYFANPFFYSVHIFLLEHGSIKVIHKIYWGSCKSALLTAIFLFSSQRWKNHKRFVYVCVSSACRYVHCVCVPGIYGGQMWASDPL